MKAPLALFAFNRPDHLGRTIAALKEADGFAETDVTVFADGPRGPHEAAAVEAVRALARAELPGAELVAAEANQGLAASVIAGVTRLVERHGRVIVLEDDLVVAPDFLTFMNAALDAYADAADVMQVSAYMPPAAALGDEAVFTRQTVSWGWATWARAWAAFEAEPMALERLDDPATRRAFNRDGAYDYKAMLERQLAGKSDSWAIRWYWSVFRRGGLVLHPPRSLVRNDGFDGSGTHGTRGVKRAAAALERGEPIRLPAPGLVPDRVAAVNRAYALAFTSRWSGLRARAARLLGRAA